LNRPPHRKLIVIELNEVTWDLVDPFIAEGKLPTFEWLKANGTWGAPLSVDLPPQLDPWVTWTTLYTGVPQSQHNVHFLEQSPETIHAKRMWELCNAVGLSVGVYGSVCSWPPKPVNGFHVPETFARDSRTYPEELHYIQDLNLTYTRSIRLPSDQDTLRFKVQLGAKLMGLGLGLSEIAQVAAQLVSERFDGDLRWKRVALQPLVNFAFFRELYQRHRPAFSTFHTNHVAHYMHTYWMAMQPDAFRPLDVTNRERATHGKAIEHGYRVADKLLRQVIELIDSDTVMVVASSMGQKPFHSRIEGGKRIKQWRSLPKLLDILGVKDRAHAVSTMSDEFCITAPDEAVRRDIAEGLTTAYVDKPEQPMFFVQAVGSTVRINLVPYSAKQVNDDSHIFFQTRGGRAAYRHGDVVYDTGQLKSGCHDPRGLAIFYGAAIPRGLRLAEYDNLDFAPTFLNILGLPVPEYMTGRVMEEVGMPAALQRAS
jgi:hypothetical protein